MSRDPLPEDDFSFLPKVDDAGAPVREVLRPGPEELAPSEAVEEAPADPSPDPGASDPVAAKAAPRFRLKVKPSPRPPSPPPAPEPEPEPGPSVQAAPPAHTDPEPKPAAVQVKKPENATVKLPADEPKAPAEKPAGEEEPHHALIRPPGAEEKHHEEVAPLTRKEKLRLYWLMIGGQSLTYSVLFHLAVVTVAAFVVFKNVSQQHVDFLPGGGTAQGEAAEKSLAETVKQRRTPWLRKTPLTRTAANNAMSEIKLPETPIDAISVPDMTRTKMDTMGFGSAGAGGGFGSGIGLGGKSGVTFQPIMMFGKSINARRMAVILDVSSSMTDYLDGVVKEVDREAKGSPVICYFGCGLMRPENGMHIDDKIDLCKNPTFERFWRIWYGPSPFNATPAEIKKIKFDPKDRIPLEEVYRPLAKRPNTYFVDYNGIVYAWTALINDLVRNADALYWFSDFMDDVEEKEIKIVLENLKRRKQRLYIHPSIHGASFEQVKNGLVIPTGGDVIEPPTN